MMDAQRLQLETLFATTYGLDENLYFGFGHAGRRGPRVQVLRSILLSLASMIFLKTCKTITMEANGPDSHEDGKVTLATQLVANEGIPSLQADYELVSRFQPE